MKNLTIKNLFFSYSNSDLISDCNFIIESNTSNFLLGLNGAGKTTLLKLILNLLKPKSGEILINNRNLREISEKELATIIAFVPQNQNSLFPYTVEEVVSTGRTPYLNYFGLLKNKDKNVVNEFVTKLDLEKLRDKKVTEISGGELRRTLLARALVQEPKILLLDEPNSYLDVEHQIKIFEILEYLRKENNLTTLTVTHDLNIAALFAENILILANGKIDMGRKEEMLTEENIKKYFRVNSQVKVVNNLTTVTITK